MLNPIRFLPKYLYGLGCSAYLFSFGVFSEKNRNLIFNICYHFGLGRRDVPLLLPQRKIEDFAPDDPGTHLLALEATSGNVTTTELIVLNRTIRRQKVRDVFEIGTFDGRTTLNMVANVEAGGKVVTLDLPAKDLENTKMKVERADQTFIKKAQSGGRFLGKRDYENRINQVYGDSASFDFSSYNGKMDMVFVDGSHAYDYVLNDARKAIKLLKPAGGLVFFHDYGTCWPGVNQALNELMQEGKEFKELAHIAGTSLAVLEIRSKIDR